MMNRHWSVMAERMKVGEAEEEDNQCQLSDQNLSILGYKIFSFAAKRFSGHVSNALHA